VFSDEVRKQEDVRRSITESVPHKLLLAAREAEVSPIEGASGPERARIQPATPLGTGRRRGPVAKRRFQKGRFVIERGMAYSFYYEDAVQPDGSVASRKVRHFIGRIGEDGISERAARREHDRIMQVVNEKRGSIAPAVRGRTFKDAVEAWRKAVAPNLSPATVRQYESYLRQHINPKFKDEAPHTLTAGVLQQFATDLRAKGLSRKSVLNVLTTMFAILKFAERCNIPIAKVGFRDVQLGAAHGETERPFFTQEQASQIIAAAKEPYKTLFTVAWLTGLRAGEILALKSSDLDFENETIRVDESSDDYTRELRQPKTKNSVALLPMPKPLHMALETYLKTAWKQNRQGLLFPNPKGTRPMLRDNVVKNGLKPVLKALGIPADGRGLHCFRHGLATELAQRGVPLPDLQKQMRHADVRTTLRIYAHSVPGSQRNVMEAVASSLFTRPIGTKVPIGTKHRTQPFVN
jgi:integrase